MAMLTNQRVNMMMNTWTPELGTVPSPLSIALGTFSWSLLLPATTGFGFLWELCRLKKPKEKSSH